MGTGAGFPGMVLKLVRPDLDVTLLDSARKRCIFLENVAHLTEVGPVPVLQMRAETHLDRDGAAGSYDVVTARAVSSLDHSLLSFGPLVAPGGWFITFKGPQWLDELHEAREGGALAVSGFSPETATRIPWTQGHILSFRKLRA